MNIHRTIILVIAFILAISSAPLASISNSSSIASASIDYSNTATEEIFKVLVTVEGVKGHCGQEVTITVAYKSETFELCEGDERPSEEQIADLISSQGHEFEFPKGQIAVGECFDVCIEGLGGYPIVRL